MQFDDTRNYKVKFFSDEENAVRLSFFLDEVHYGDFNEIPEDAKQRCDPGPLQDCSFKFKQGSDEVRRICSDFLLYFVSSETGVWQMAV